MKESGRGPGGDQAGKYDVPLTRIVLNQPPGEKAWVSPV